MKKVGLWVLCAALCVVFAACQQTENLSEPAKESGLSESSLQASVPVESSSQESVSSQNAQPTALDASKPDDALRALLESAKKWDVDAISQFLPEGVALEQYLPASLQDSVAQAMGRMEYKITEVRENGAAAEVLLDVSAVSAEGAVGDALVSATAYIVKQKIAGNPVEDPAELAAVVAEAIDVAGLPMQTTSVTAHMVKSDDGAWRLDLSGGRNFALLNTVSGGSLELVQRFQDLASEYSIPLN